jgi:hypothetical protein
MHPVDCQSATSSHNNVMHCTTTWLVYKVIINKFAKAASMSLGVPAESTSTCPPRLEAAVCASVITDSLYGGCKCYIDSFMAQDNRSRAPADVLIDYGFQPSSAQQLRSDGQRHSPNPAFDVYDSGGRYIGSDPDIRIRGALQRDPPGAGR